MARQTISQRRRFFVAVEGESEQSFITWLQRLSQSHVPIHLDCAVLGGGGFKSMLQKAVIHHKKGCIKGKYEQRFLIVDSDRSEQGDWSIGKLKENAKRENFIVCIQNPNHEGLLYRMTPNREHENPPSARSEEKLRAQWPTYRKPANANDLNSRYSLSDLLRVAEIDTDLETLLKTIGLMGT